MAASLPVPPAWALARGLAWTGWLPGCLPPSVGFGQEAGLGWVAAWMSDPPVLELARGAPRLEFGIATFEFFDFFDFFESFRMVFHLSL